MTPQEAARFLGVDEATLRSLVRAGYLRVLHGRIPHADVRAFQARNADGGSGGDMSKAADVVDMATLLDALEMRRGELAGRAFEVFARALPEANSWSEQQKAMFAEQAHARYSAILAVVSMDGQLDAGLHEDLVFVGAAASGGGASLAQILTALRVSRDLLLQMAVTLSLQHEGRWDAVLVEFMAKLPPAIDHMTDAMSEGYWRVAIDEVRELAQRFEYVIERSPCAFYEADMDGIVRFATPNLAAVVAAEEHDLVESSLGAVFPLAEGSVEGLLAEPEDGVSRFELTLVQPGGPVEVVVDAVVRRDDGGGIAGFAGIVRRREPVREAPPVDLTPLIRHIHELRRSVEQLQKTGTIFMEQGASMIPAHVVRGGESVRRQADRLMTIIDELDADRQAIRPAT